MEIVRAHGSVRYPARLQLIAAMNPCRCGWYGDPVRACRCPVREPQRYLRRVSGPLLDRIDLRVVMPRLDATELVGPRVRSPAPAWLRASARPGSGPWHAAAGVPTGSSAAVASWRRAPSTRPPGRPWRRSREGLELTARSVHRVMRVARTIADLRDLGAVGSTEILAAASLRDRSLENGAGGMTRAGGGR